VFSRLNVGGPSVHVILLTAGLAPLGYETRLVVGREAPWEGNCLDLAAARGVTVEVIEGLGREIRPLNDLRAFFALLRLIRAFRPHVVHTHASKAGLLGRLAAVLGRVPVVVHTYHGHVLRGYFGWLKTLVFRGAERALAASCDALIAVSESVREDLLRLRVAPPARIRVVPLGLDLVPLSGVLPRGGLRKVAGVPDAAPLVGIVGRLAPIKDVGSFLEAAALVRRSLPGAHFAVVGDGEERGALEGQARALGLGDAVHFHGWRRDMAAVYGDLDLVVNASRNEGTPVALIEALAAGRAVVATDVGGTPDVLARGAHGVLVPPGDPPALAAAILESLQAPVRAQERARAGQASVLVRHAAARLVGDVDGLYRELLAGRDR
jgi:glycosyltransferase involved in cell wall biosynthesis